MKVYPIYTHGEKCPCADCWVIRYARMFETPAVVAEAAVKECKNHRKNSADGDCIRCGKTTFQMDAEREARANKRTARPVLSSAELAAMDYDRRLKNESRRDRRAFHGGR
jgi:hypothetical protein